MRRLTLFLSICFVSFYSESQITVDQSYTIDQYVNDILLGSGVQAFNISYTGSDVQIGLLQNGDGTVYPMSEGLVLSSANAGALDLNFSGFDTEVPFGEGVTGDADLLNIANSVPGMIGQDFSVGSINDLCVLEFDFIATGDSVKFNYAFGSDEYLEWVNTQYNDIFAFFLSGPGISGPYASPAGFPDGAVNIAQVPDSDPPLPITISSVNNVLNSAYYIDNPSNNDLSLDGFTTLLEASHTVQCGETYHIKLAIADGSDNVLESVVVLQTGSFTSNSVVQVDLTIDVGGPDAEIIFEDCGIATLTFTRPIETILEVEEIVFIEYGGTAEEGVDYNFLPDSIVFAPFVESVSFTIDAFEDGLSEGIEQVQLEILNLAACNGGGLTSYFEFDIGDYPDPLVVDDYDITMCQGDTMEIFPAVSGGYGNYQYNWSTGDTTSSVFVNPVVSTNYNVIVSDTCGMPPDDGNINIDILVFDPLEVSIDQGDVTLNCGDFVNLTATASGGDGVYSNWLWYDQDGGPLFGFENSFWLSSFDGASEVTVSVTDGCGFEATNTIDVNLNIPALLVESDEVTVACDEDVQACVTVSGGQPGYSYTWYLNGIPDFSQFNNCFIGLVVPGDVLSVEVSDNCGQTEEEIINLQFPDTDISISLPTSVEGTCIDEFVVEPEVTGGTSPYFYQWSNDGFNLGGGSPLTFVPGENMTVQLQVTDQCGYQLTDTFNVVLTNPPVVVDLPSQLLVSCADTTSITAEQVIGIPDLSYSWIIDAVEVGTDTLLNWHTLDDEFVLLEVTDACGSIGSDTVSLIINDPPIVLSVTPEQIICEGESAEISVIAQGGVAPYIYFWHSLNSNEQDQLVTPEQDTQYQVSATDVCGQFEIATATVNLSPIEVAYFLSSVSESEYEFGSAVYPPCDENCQYLYLWDFGDGSTSDLANPIHTYNAFEIFEGNLTVTNEIGCQASVDFIIEPPPMLYIPSAFTPNNDGINDYFRVYGTSIEKFEITIYNSWGAVVYHSKDVNEVWVGEITDRYYYAQNQVYNYVVKMKGKDTDIVTRKGEITIVR